ncbi:MAG TPA: hypothetical protein VGE07_21040 [Herpetosiphonaceae bacterium]
MTQPPGGQAAAALVALMAEIRALWEERGYAPEGALRLPLWSAAAPTGELTVLNESGRFPARAVVTIAWSAEIAAALATAERAPAPGGSLAVSFCWQRPPEREWRDSELADMAGNLAEAMADVEGLQSFTITIPTVFDATAWHVGLIDLRDTWHIPLADLADPTTRATVVARIAAHALGGIEWL